MLRHRWKLLFLALMLAVSPAFAQIGISPQLLDVRIDGPAAVHSLKLFNFTDEEKHVEVVVHNWTFDAAGEVELIAPTEHSLERWIIINPLRFTIPPKGTQTVRVAIRPGVELPPGEHRGIVYFEEVLPPLPPDQPAGMMRGRFRIGAAVYGQVGEPMRTAELSDIVIAADQLQARLTATGSANTRMTGHYGIWPAATAPEDPARVLQALVADKAKELPEDMSAFAAINNAPVLPGQQRVVLTPLDQPLAPGRYVLAMVGTLGDGPLAVTRTLEIAATDG